MPLTGSGSDHLSMLLRKLAALPHVAPEMIATVVPTVEVLLSHATGTIPPEQVPYAERKYEVDDEMQQRIDENTSVRANGMHIEVGLAGDNPHLRPLVPVSELPLKWRGAISQKVNGAVRRYLAMNRALAFVRETLTDEMLVSELNARARAAGVKGRAYREAKQQLGVVKTGRGKKAKFSRPT